MNLHEPEPGLRRVNTADFLSLIALALFVTYGVTVLNTILPLAILQPAWLVTLISALLDSSPLALLGLGLVHLVAYLEPDDVQVQERRDAVARWAIAAVVGFVLLLPLQTASAVQGFDLVARSQSSALKVATERAEEFRRAIDGASSVADLQERIASLQGPGLRLTESTSQSLPELKKVLVERLDESVRSSTAIITSPWNPNLWAIVQRTLRIFILTVIYGLAFAAGSQRRNSDLSLLRENQMRWDVHWAQRGERRRERLESRRRHRELQEQEEMEARAQAMRQDSAEAEEGPGLRVPPPRGLPADIDYFHQLSVEEEERKD
ncbi:hypothetical protein [Synechococcus sp. CCY 9618]|uniref:hypothetical protein n=1 Tax=Synechococcus sp. CCY 9618 TaxID=2815602 RepID=UPI001C24B50D|nr:hypothetical protein [Synechococcus sp. CCY 9618]